MGIAPFKAPDRAALKGGMLGRPTSGASTNTRRSSYLLTHFFARARVSNWHTAIIGAAATVESGIWGVI